MNWKKLFCNRTYKKRDDFFRWISINKAICHPIQMFVFFAAGVSVTDNRHYVLNRPQILFVNAILHRI